MADVKVVVLPKVVCESRGGIVETLANMILARRGIIGIQAFKIIRPRFGVLWPDTSHIWGKITDVKVVLLTDVVCEVRR